MKNILKIITFILIFAFIFTGCAKPGDIGPGNGDGTTGTTETSSDETTFGEELKDTDAYGGYFEEKTSDITVEYISGTPGCYTMDGNTLTFTEVSEESVYSVSGKLNGNIVIDVGDENKFELELHGLSLVSESDSPIVILSGDKVSLKATKDYENYIYDMRETVAEDDETVYSGAVHSEVDLEISGKGKLTVVSENNNGIHTKDDLEVKNLTLFVSCTDNALKGNDSVEITGGNLTLIASAGDGIKTSNSDISDKGNQRGTISINGGTHTVYAACDGLDASYDVLIDGDTVLNIYTDKYSNYSEEITAVSESQYYIRYTDNRYGYSVKYYNSDEDYVWVNATYHSTVSGGRTNYYYYTFPKKSEYAKMQFFIYSSDMQQGQEDDYLVASDYLTRSEAYDTFALTERGNSLSYSWTNYTTVIQDGGFGGRPGMGGMNDGNTDKSEHSTKGIKAADEIVINSGNITVKSYDDAIHANCDTVLENGETPLGNVTINGGNISLYSNDDAVHADNVLSIASGTVSISHSYEGLEGSFVNISGGDVSVISSDDGINGVSTTGTAINISGGTVYIYAGGDGIDSNSRTSYSGIIFSGGKTVVISSSSGNSAIDSEQGYKYSAGAVVAIMPRGGMTNESTHCQNFTSVGSAEAVSLTKDSYLTVGTGSENVTVKMPCSLSAYVVVLGSNSPSVSTQSNTAEALDNNGVCWN